MKKTFESTALDDIRERLLEEVENRTGQGEDFSTVIIDGVEKYVYPNDHFSNLVIRAADFVEMLRHERPETQRMIALRLNGRNEKEISRALGCTQQAVSKKLGRIIRAVEQGVENEQAEIA